MRSATVAPFCGVLMAFACIAGCGSNMADVKGTVKYDGQLVESGAIRFEPADGKAPTAGGEIKAGQYAVKVPVGNMKVSISGAKVTGKKKLDDSKDSPEMEVKGEALPPKYSDYQKTALQYEVSPGVNTKDWDLSK